MKDFEESKVFFKVFIFQKKAKENYFHIVAKKIIFNSSDSEDVSSLSPIILQLEILLIIWKINPYGLVVSD